MTTRVQRRIAKAKKLSSSGSGLPSVASSSIPGADELFGAFLRPPSSTPNYGKSDVQIALFHYNNNGTVFGSQFKSGSVACLKMMHNVKPSLLYSLPSNLLQFFKTHMEDEAFPQTLPLWETTFGSKLVVTDGSDVDNVGTFEKGAKTIFVDETEEAIMDMISFIDEYISWYSKQPEAAEIYADGVQIVLTNTLNMELDVTEVTNQWTVKVDVADPKELFCIHPPVYPRRLVKITIELKSAATISVVFSGNTKPYFHNISSSVGA